LNFVFAFSTAMPVKRVDKGTEGKVIQVRTNFFPVVTLPNSVIYHYSVSIQPNVPPAKNQRIFLLWEQNSNDTGTLNGVKPVYDGRHNMYSPIALFDSEMTTFQVDYCDEDEFPICENPTERDLERIPKTFELTFTKITDISMDQLRRFLKGFGSLPPDEAIDALDVVLRHRPSLMFTNVGRCFYTADAAHDIANGATLWQGFHQSIKPTKGGLLVNLDVSATAFYQSGPVIDIVLQIVNRAHPSDIRSISDKDGGKIDRQLKGLKIIVTHRGQIRRKYKIVKCVKDARQTKFALNDSEEIISVYDFFLKKYKMALKFPHLPCILVGDASRPMYFPMEVCEIVPGQRHVKRLNERQVRFF
jgi:hypothetical protein